MLARATLLGLAAFWLTMNVLLWRAEYGGGPSLGSSVPAMLVWEKILTAPDGSSLTILRRGKRIGFCHWLSSVGGKAGKGSAGEFPEGMVRQITHYRLELNGSLAMDDAADRLRFDSRLELDGHRAWKEFEARLTLRSDSWRVRSMAAEQTVLFAWHDDSQQFRRVFTFAELQHPEQLLQEFGVPWGAGMFGGLGLGQDAGRRQLKDTAARWQARFESVKFGHSYVRVYRLQADLLDRFAVVALVSPVGEILRIELPDGIVMANDQLGGR